MKIAIIGVAGRFPGASTIDEFWKNLCDGKESITFFDDEELHPGISPALKSNPRYVKARGVIEDIDEFDPQFFGMTPREAEIMDPQQRVLLEIAWEAFENAGYNPELYSGLIGVFAGTGLNTYYTNNLLNNEQIFDYVGQHNIQLANAPDYLTTRVSFKFNLKGPSISLYTGCSTSLVAVCKACDSLLHFECDMALAGGAFVSSPLNSGYLYQEGEMFSIDGHTRPFDANATGTVFSSGAGAVLLKRLDEAISDGDFIYAVIRGTAVNNDGSDKVSFTAPSVKGQSAVVAMSLANAGLDPGQISYIETHGTGTPLGDPIEIEALTQAFRSGTKAKQFCAIGSVKGNIGHLDAAAGIAGLIKTALALHKKTIPPSINFHTPNPHINFADTPFYVNSELKTWEGSIEKRFAGITSLGVGGTNAHVILEEAPLTNNNSSSDRRRLIKLSAKNKAVLDKTAVRLADFLDMHPRVSLDDVAFTLQQGRKDFDYRQIVVCKDIPELINLLRAKNPEQVTTLQYRPVSGDVVFMFPGQGAQYPYMLHGLYLSEPVFREHIDRCSEILEKHASFNLKEVLYPAGLDLAVASDVLKQTSITQPAMFSVEYALARLWMSWGVFPDLMVGHSIGEYVAACIAGVFTLEDALRVVAERGKLIQSLPAGVMLAVFISEHEMQPFLTSKISLAVINGPSLCVVSGKENVIRELENTLTQAGKHCARLHTSHAFHSHMMEPIMAEFGDLFSRIETRAPRIPFVSNVTGKRIDPDEVIRGDYWVRHLRNTVRFSDCLGTLFADPDRIFIEVGPGNTLQTLASQHPGKKSGHIVLSSGRHPQEEIADEVPILQSLGLMWMYGKSINWQALSTAERCRRTPLPAYPFEKQRCWLEPSMTGRFNQMEVTDLVKEADTPPEQSAPEEQMQVATLDISKTDVNYVETTILNIWKRLLGYSHLSRDNNYFELGGNSLMAVRMFVQIEKEFGKRLPLAVLYDAPTVEKLARIIIREDYIPSWSSLVKIQPLGFRPPFFCIHAEGGNVLEYRLLANYLGDDQPFYGLQAQGLDGKSISNFTIGQMATAYIQEIKTVQPYGPYYLGGYCLGGLVAFEMAHQLQNRGEQVAPLILISTSTPDHLRRLKPNISVPQKALYRCLDRFQLEIDNLSVLGFRGKLRHLLDRFTRTYGDIQYGSERLLDIVFSRFSRDFKWHTRDYALKRTVDLTDNAYMAYDPKPLENTIHLVRVSKQKRELVFDPSLGWKDLSTKGLYTYEVEGFHKNVMKEPYVKHVAHIMSSILENTNQQNLPLREKEPESEHGLSDTLGGEKLGDVFA